MSESLSNNESNETITKPKLFGLPRTWAGAFIGVLIFLLIYWVSYNADFGFLTIVLSAFGIWTDSMLRSLIPGSSGIFEYPIVVVVVCSIPSAILGALIISKKRGYKLFGFIMLAMYLIFSFSVALSAYLFAIA